LAVKGLFTKINEILFGAEVIKEYGGEVGGFRYMILYDIIRGEVISHFITPPKKYSRRVGGKVDALGYSVGAEYQSEYDYAETIAVVNKDAKLNLKPQELLSRVNENRLSRGEPEIKTTEIIELGRDEKFYAGRYIGKTNASSINRPEFDAHFDNLTPAVKSGLTLWLHFVTEIMYDVPVKQSKNKKVRNAVFRSAIFLPDMVKGQLKMHVSHNMEKHPDNMIAFPMDVGLVSYVYKNKKRTYTDVSASKPDTYGDLSSFHIWENLKSILAVPITDSNNVCLGILTIDTDQPYNVARFDEQGLNDMLTLVTTGIGRLLEAYI